MARACVIGIIRGIAVAVKIERGPIADRRAVRAKLVITGRWD